jgi:hypothetical protein
MRGRGGDEDDRLDGGAGVKRMPGATAVDFLL